MADIDVPFNFDPVDNLETTASYTVPAGSYAIMTATLDVSMRASVTALIGGIILTDTQNYALDSNSNSAVVELRLKAGEVVTKTLSTGSSSSSTTGFELGYIHVSSTATAELKVNSTTVSKITAPGSCAVHDIAGNANDNISANVTGLSEINWHIAEYNSIT
jgi:hypothetical protein